MFQLSWKDINESQFPESTGLQSENTVVYEQINLH